MNTFQSDVGVELLDVEKNSAVVSVTTPDEKEPHCELFRKPKKGIKTSETTPLAITSENLNARFRRRIAHTGTSTSPKHSTHKAASHHLANRSSNALLLSVHFAHRRPPASFAL
uniref:Uncharacterized protein n=1 Tax=Parascaris equorum TaxID=6256 RepID=A0A914R9H3_PAREQ